MKFIKKLIYLYPTVKLFKAHRLGEYSKVEEFLNKLPNSYVEDKIPFLIIKARNEMRNSQYLTAVESFKKSINKIEDSETMNEDEKKYLFFYVNKGLDFCSEHVDFEVDSIKANKNIEYNKNNIRRFILNNFEV